jgi:hypothetical protein
MRLEHWLRTHVISRIPGATGGEDRLAGEPLRPVRDHPELRRAPGGHLLSDLLGARVRSAGGEDLGTVLDVDAVPTERTGLELGRLRVVSITYGPRALGAELGYTTDPRQGPLLVAAVFRRVQRHHRRVPWRDVAAVDWAERVLTLSATARPVHPHTA